jgi:hypothetical protein
MDSTFPLYQKNIWKQKFFLYFRTKQIPCFWFRTSSLAKKLCALARRIRIHFWRIPLRITCEIQAETIGTRFARPAFWLLKNRLVLFWCVYCTKSEPIFKIGNVERPPRATRLCAEHRASAKQKCGERIRTPLAEYGDNPERKTPFPFSRKISHPPNQKSKECFSFGILPSKYSDRRSANAIRTRFCETIFAGVRDSQNRD